jgi:peptide deformylase
MEKKRIKIFQKGEKVLNTKAKEVPRKEIKSTKIQNVIKKMEQVILENDEALAVAAPQIGESLRITVISEWALNPDSIKSKTEFKNMVFINPKILNTSKKKILFPEGCLSAPNLFGTVERSEKVKFEAYNEKGEKITRGASGVLAQAIQHEIDHLNGTLFVDKALFLSDINNG